MLKKNKVYFARKQEAKRKRGREEGRNNDEDEGGRLKKDGKKN